MAKKNIRNRRAKRKHGILMTSCVVPSTADSNSQDSTNPIKSHGVTLSKDNHRGIRGIKSPIIIAKRNLIHIDQNLLKELKRAHRVVAGGKKIKIIKKNNGEGGDFPPPLIEDCSK